MVRCNVCGADALDMLYEMQSGMALTSLGETYPSDTRVWACNGCSHVQTDEMEEVDQYYAEQYNILADSEEEDQIYEVRNGHPIYRTAHQLAVLQNKLALHSGARVLDYGCAKSSTMQVLLKARADLQVHLFDVSDSYRKYWSRFLPEAQCASFVPKPEWTASFDVVTSFFALEHIVQPVEALRAIFQLVRPGGMFYCVVPNVLTNIADFIVVDHVNHFTRHSMEQALHSAGFETVEVDADCHRGAFVVLARRPQSPIDAKAAASAPAGQQVLELKDIAAFWQEAANRVTAFMAELPSEARVAVYGAGFYGSFIAACLGGAERVDVFVDQNPFLQGKSLLGKPIVAPQDVNASIDTLLVGLNPAYAKPIIADIPAFQSRNLRSFFL